MTIHEAHEEVEAALNQLRPVFQPHCQLTFIMRRPGDDEGDMVISNDDLDELAKVIQRTKARLDAETPGGE